MWKCVRPIPANRRNPALPEQVRWTNHLAWGMTFPCLPPRPRFARLTLAMSVKPVKRPLNERPLGNQGHSSRYSFAVTPWDSSQAFSFFDRDWGDEAREA